MPKRRTFGTRRQIAPFRIAPRIAEAHTDDGDARLVVECIAIDIEPLAQTIAAPVVKGEAGLMHLRAGRLTDDEKPRRGMAANDRPRTQRQLRRANRASANLFEEL